MSELGETRDPVALIPGDPDALNRTIADLASYGDVLHEAGAGLQRIDTAEGWSGAAADQFRSLFDGQPRHWLDAGDAFKSASGAVDGFLSTLTWAQNQALDAINQWDAAQDATERAQSSRAVGQSNNPFTDPGESGRQAARDILARARSQLAAAGAMAADLVDRAKEKAPPKPGFWSELGSELEHFGEDLGHTVLNTGAEAVNDVASFGNAALHHPLAAGTEVAGALLTAASSAGEVGGAALDVTPAAPAGLALGGVSTAGVVAGVGMMGAATANMMQGASGEDHVEVVNTDSGAAPPPGEDPPFQPPENITGYRDHAKEQMLGRNGGRGVNDAAAQDAFDNPIKAPQYRPDQYGGSYRYTGQDAVVNVNKHGEVTTAWARRKAGMRNPR